MSLELDLTGRRVLVTGGGQGIGQGIAFGFASAGAQVLVNDVVPERAEDVAGQIVAQGGVALALPFDVTDYDAVASAAADTRVDVLVNNAGNAGVHGWEGRGPFAESDPADWDRYLKVNLYGVMNCARATLPGMIANRWGRIVTIVSDAGRSGDPGGAAYGAAKAGAAGLCRTLAVENGRYGITVNTIALGTMRTPATEAMWATPDNPAAKQMMQRYVVRRPGLPEDVAPMAVFLASEQASWITGQTYPVNGGFSFAL